MSSEKISAVLCQIEALEKTLLCYECNNVMREPTAVGRCSHIFCKKCISNSSSKECPVCKFPVTIKDSYPDRQLIDLLAQLEKLKEMFSSSCCTIEETYLGSLPEKLTSDFVQETPIVNESTPKSKSKNDIPDLLKLNSPERSKSPEDESDAKENVMVTPKNIGLKKRQAFSTPCNKLRSPLRFKAFSAQKVVTRKKLRSPKSSGLASPAAIEKRNAKGETPLHVAVIKGDYLRVRQLLKQQANPNVKDNAGWTPLHEASNHGYFEITQVLVENGAVVNVPGEDNITPLHDAIMNEQIPIACYLASKGGDIYAKTSHGNTALDLCHNEDDKKSLIEAYNSHSKPDASGAVQTSRTKKSKMIFLYTSLDTTQKENLQKCAQLIKADLVDDFGPEVSHIVTSCDEHGQCNRTLKILQGILSGKWIVSYKWIEMCLEYKKKLPEEAFEIPGTKQHPDTFGPKRARENFTKQCPRLFDGCNFYIHGNINPPMPGKEDLSQLIQLGGGRMLAREPRVETISLEQHLIPFHTIDGPMADIGHFILYQDKPPREVQVRMNHICTVSVHWFLACISQFKLLDTEVINKK